MLLHRPPNRSSFFISIVDEENSLFISVVVVVVVVVIVVVIVVVNCCIVRRIQYLFVSVVVVVGRRRRRRGELLQCCIPGFYHDKMALGTSITRYAATLPISRLSNSAEGSSFTFFFAIVWAQNDDYAVVEGRHETRDAVCDVASRAVLQ